MSVKEKYDRIGLGYNQTRKADPYLTSRLVHHLKGLEGEKYLEIGCGTGNYTIALHASGLQMIGVEPSQAMINIAKERNQSIIWKEGHAEDIPLNDEQIDGVVANLTIHHWSDLRAGLKEVYRVLKPGGRLVIFTSAPEQMESYWLTHFFPNMMKSACLQMPRLELINDCLLSNQFKHVESEVYSVRSDLQDLFLQSGKHDPERYFREDIRRGISTFADLANAKEVEEGLAKLRLSIDDGSIQSIIDRFESELGDYIYIIASK